MPVLTAAQQLRQLAHTLHSSRQGSAMRIKSCTWRFKSCTIHALGLVAPYAAPEQLLVRPPASSCSHRVRTASRFLGTPLGAHSCSAVACRPLRDAHWPTRTKWQPFKDARSCLFRGNKQLKEEGFSVFIYSDRMSIWDLCRRVSRAFKHTINT